MMCAHVMATEEETPMIYNQTDKTIIYLCPVCNKYWDNTKDSTCPATGAFGTCCHEGQSEISKESLEEFLNPTINDDPVINSISPIEGEQGSTISVVITGSNFCEINSVSFGDGITVESFAIDSRTQITAILMINTDAVIGHRNIQINSYILEDGFEVIGAKPIVNLINPASGYQDTTIDISITGSNLSGATISIENVQVNSTTVDASRIDANITLGSVYGKQDVVITTQYGVVTITDGFTIKQTVVNTDTQYGTGAYEGTNPIGGGNGYKSTHGFTLLKADYVVTTLSQLNAALQKATSGQVIWIPDGTVIEVPTIAAAGKRMILPYPIGEGVVLASNRGENGAAGGKIKVTGTVTGAFQTGIRVKSRAILSGITIEGPTNRGFAGTTTCYTLCALKLSGAYGVEIENCNLYNFPESIISIDNILAIGPDTQWNSTNRHRIHHCEIHGAQAHGWGYGILQSNSNGKSLACLVSACKVYNCRHEFACDHGTLANFEIEYSEIGNAWYYYVNKTEVYYSGQVDAHGGGTNAATCAGEHYEVHHNTFESNPGKPTGGIRGIPKDRANFYNNWTKKTDHDGIYPANNAYETSFSGDDFVALCASEGGAWTGTNNLTKYNVFVWNNWYGNKQPPTR